ncbi:hypothetical protein [Serinicoccus marinus]|uniref:hypothetical protein n=1 Tax=Serinicoccus marinus TaxID=247333 RepID=UPI002490F96B|nr:hypothetical protein [Serinicoccus marinus]
MSLVDSTPADATAQLERAHAGLGEVPLSVEVVEVEESGDVPQAQGRLRLTWDLPGEGEDLAREVPMRSVARLAAPARRASPARLAAPARRASSARSEKAATCSSEVTSTSPTRCAAVCRP